MGETCVPNDPKRIIIIGHEILGQALSLGIKPIAAGSNPWFSKLENLKSPFLSTQNYLGTRLEGIRNIGQATNPNLESILKLKPDLILSWNYVGGIYPLLSQIAPTVMISMVDARANWQEVFNFTAETLERETEAQQIWHHYSQRIEELKTALGSRYHGKTFSIAFAYGQSIYMFPKNSFAGSIFADLGLQRPSSQDVFDPHGRIGNISDERLDVVDGDILFFGVSDYGHTEAYESLKQKPLWKRLKAVQQRQVYLYHAPTWTGGSPLEADMVLDDLYKYLVDTPQNPA